MKEFQNQRVEVIILMIKVIHHENFTIEHFQLHKHWWLHDQLTGCLTRLTSSMNHKHCVFQR